MAGAPARPGAVNLDDVCSGLRLAEDGIWYGRQPAEVSYPGEGYEMCFDVEEGSFWFRHRNACIVEAVRGHPPEGGTIFDVGGGNGFVAKRLAEAGYDVALIEPGRAGALHAKARGVRTVVCATLAGAGCRAGTVPACGLFDVLEHVDDDVGFLRSIASLLSPGGRLYLTVPAYPFLWSSQDELAGHFRRYTLDSLSRALGRSGFEVSFATYIFRPLPPAILLLRVLPYRLGWGRGDLRVDAVRRDHASGSRTLSRFLEAMLSSEVTRIRRRSPMRFGGSCLAVATKAAGAGS